MIKLKVYFFPGENYFLCFGSNCDTLTKKKKVGLFWAKKNMNTKSRKGRRDDENIRPRVPPNTYYDPSQSLFTKKTNIATLSLDAGHLMRQFSFLFRFFKFGHSSCHHSRTWNARAFSAISKTNHEQQKLWLKFFWIWLHYFVIFIFETSSQSINKKLEFYCTNQIKTRILVRKYACQKQLVGSPRSNVWKMVKQHIIFKGLRDIMHGKFMLSIQMTTIPTTQKYKKKSNIIKCKICDDISLMANWKKEKKKLFFMLFLYFFLANGLFVNVQQT